MDSFETTNKDKDNLVGVEGMSKYTLQETDSERTISLSLKGPVKLGVEADKKVTIDASELFIHITQLEQQVKSEYERGVDFAAQQVMNEMVDYSKEVIRLKDEIAELKTEIKGWSDANGILTRSRNRWKFRAGDIEDELESIKGEG